MAKCCDLHERLILFECRFSEGSTRLKEFKEWMKGGKELFNTASGKALFCFTLNSCLITNDRIHSACIHSLFRSAHLYPRRWPRISQLFEGGRGYVFSAISCEYLYYWWAAACVPRLCRIWWENTAEFWKQQLNERWKHEHAQILTESDVPVKTSTVNGDSVFNVKGSDVKWVFSQPNSISVQGYKL